MSVGPLVGVCVLKQGWLLTCCVARLTRLAPRLQVRALDKERARAGAAARQMAQLREQLATQAAMLESLQQQAGHQRLQVGADRAELSLDRDQSLALSRCLLSFLGFVCFSGVGRRVCSPLASVFFL